MYSTVQYENNIYFLDPIREYIGRSRGTNVDCRLVRFIRYIIITFLQVNKIENPKKRKHMQVYINARSRFENDLEYKKLFYDFTYIYQNVSFIKLGNLKYNYAQMACNTKLHSKERKF